MQEFHPSQRNKILTLIDFCQWTFLSKHLEIGYKKTAINYKTDEIT